MILWTPGRTLAEIEKDVIFAALKFYQNNKVHTAKSLGICYKTLNNKLEAYNGTTKLQEETLDQKEVDEEKSKKAKKK